MNVLPYVIGQWVRGEKFYGRRELLAELRQPGWHHVAGLRRIGKTSLLKQLEHLELAQEAACLPLFWDLQGAESAEDLAWSFGDALLDAEECFERLGIPAPAPETRQLAPLLEAVLSALTRRGAGLLLLIDEADALAAFDRREPDLLAALWGVLRAFGRARVVLASSVRLGELSGFAAARRYLATLTRAEARALLTQDQLPEATRPRLPPAAEVELLTACGDHPMLLQMAGKRFQEVGDAAETLRQLAADRAVQHLLAVDFDLLTFAEQEFLAAVARGGAARVSPRRLLALGLLRQEGEGLVLPNQLLHSWLVSKTS